MGKSQGELFVIDRSEHERLMARWSENWVESGLWALEEVDADEIDEMNNLPGTRDTEVRNECEA